MEPHPCEDIRRRTVALIVAYGRDPGSLIEHPPSRPAELAWRVLADTLRIDPPA